jgi:hypothetical protein
VNSQSNTDAFIWLAGHIPGQSRMTSEQVLSVLQSLECELHEPQARRNGQRLAETLPTKVHAENFRLVVLTPVVGLLTYRSAHIAPSGELERPTNRSSVWMREPTGWQMVFHQGTPAEDSASKVI